MIKTNANLYSRFEQSIEHLVSIATTQPSLEDLARAACMSETHYQRTFTEWVGISPKQFLQVIHRANAKRQLPTQSVTNTAADLGYSSESRLYDSFVKFEGLTPAEYKRGGAGVNIEYGIAKSPFGFCCLAWSSKGICKLAFLKAGSDSETDRVEADLSIEWPKAVLSRVDGAATALAQDVFSSTSSNAIRGAQSTNTNEIKVWVKGTVFQVKVWEALLAIPEGEVASYNQIATMIGQPKAVRAVASAIAKNPIGYLIPCHRVIRSTGAINQYRWGAERKAALLIKELASTAD